jgi:hypothetical protein
MRPGTLHFVLGPDHTIVHGRHFYSASTMASTCAAALHTTILNPVITNQDHKTTRSYFGRMMAVWVEYFLGGTSKHSKLQLLWLFLIQSHL